jgi:hypothetical protein
MDVPLVLQPLASLAPHLDHGAKMMRRIVGRRSLLSSSRAKGSSSSLESQLEQAWTSSRLLAPAVRALALQTKSKTKVSLLSLERLLATSLWENEWSYAYVVARELLDKYPSEAEGGINMINSVLAMHAMEQYNQINELVTDKALVAHIERWKQKAKSRDIEAYNSPHNLEAITAILEAVVRSDNVTAAVQRCNLVLNGVLKVAHRLDSGDQHQAPILLEPRALRTLKKVSHLPEAFACAPLLEEYIGSTLIRFYRFLLQDEKPHRRLSPANVHARLEVVRAIAVLISCILDKDLMKDSVDFYIENLQDILGPHSRELSACILFSDLCKESHVDLGSKGALGEAEVRLGLARQVLDTAIELSSQPSKVKFKPRVSVSSRRDCFASFYEAGFALAAIEGDFHLYTIISGQYRARHSSLLGSSAEGQRCLNSALQALGVLLDRSVLAENRDVRTQRVGAELASMAACSPNIAPDVYTVVTAMLGKPEASVALPSEKDVAALVSMTRPSTGPSYSPPSSLHRLRKGHRQTMNSNLGIAIMEWCFAFVDTHREGTLTDIIPPGGAPWTPPLLEHYEDVPEEAGNNEALRQPRHPALRDEDKVMLQEVALLTWNALNASASSDTSSLRSFVDFSLHKASSARYRNAPLLLSLANALHEDILRRANEGQSLQEEQLPFSASAIDQAIYGCASAGEAPSSWHGISALFSLCLDARIPPSSSSIFYLVHALCNLGYEERAAKAVLVITKNVQAASEKRERTGKCKGKDEEGEGEGDQALFLKRNRAVLPPLVSFTEAAARLLKRGHTKVQESEGNRALVLAEDLYATAREVYGEEVYAPPRPFQYRNNIKTIPPPQARRSTYTMHEGLLRIPAVQRTRWLAREASTSQSQSEAAARIDDDSKENSDWMIRLKRHILDCEAYYSSISESGGRGASGARMGLQEVYIAAIQSLVKAERARATNVSSSHGGDGLAAEGAIHYLKRMLTSPVIAFPRDREGERGTEQVRRERRAREAFDLVLQVTIRQGGLRAASLMREMRAMLAQYEGGPTTTSASDDPTEEPRGVEKRTLYEEWVPHDEKY